jgi:hypothetical protein
MSSRKAKSQIRTCTATSAHAVLYGFEKQRLAAPARTLALALPKQLASAQLASHHHHHLYKQRDHTTSGNELFFCVWRKPRPNQSSSPPPPGKKAKSQKHKNRALLERRNGAKLFHLVLVTATPQETKRASVFWPRAKKTRLASSIVFMSSPAHVSVSQRTSCYRDACSNNETLSAKKEEYFLENQEGSGLERLLEINIETSRRGALI